MSVTATQPHIPPTAFGMKSAPAYEFPKRKRWADLLLTELVDDVAFILSPSYKILYCGTSITEILGWKDIDLIDLDFLDLLAPTDHDRFRITFERSIQSGAEVNILTKLKAAESMSQYSDTPLQDVVFEVKFYPHSVTTENDKETKCVFAMASPYPSRNTAMLNTIMDLKAENGRLLQKVTEYRNRLPPEMTSPANSSSSQAGSMYATSTLNPPRNPSVPGTSLQKAAELSGAYFASLSVPLDGAALAGPADTLDLNQSSYTSHMKSLEDQAEEGSKKKKMKRTQNAEQYVCIKCGRTDSPEWRKGPLGPKTLCNACGLRWAKQMRKVDEPAEGAAPSMTAPEE